jgi:Brp/Blh family beta-carotene 15,15'-monooxygenase
MILLIPVIANYFMVRNVDDFAFMYMELISVLILNIIFTPLIAFTIYFCFLHSIRHSASLIHKINSKNFSEGLKEFLKKATPLTLVTAILFILSIYILTNYFVLDEAILKVIFIGLASLTFPHILLEYLLEKNEK